jgi:4-amino-4-deoxy-L-arabinose transferase-like glycosyltransferase
MSTKIKLLLVLLLALLIRCWNINTLPSLNPDEAALGYNAYSLLKTGLDEHGVPWPIHFKSFGDYKPGGYVYLDLPFIKIFGLTPLAIRLPNLIFSILTIFLLYRLVLLLSSSKKLSIFSSLVLSLSPWHIHFSRGAWESNTALFFILLGVYWFYSYVINHKSYFLYLFPLPLVVSLYTYHSARIIVPILFLTLFFIHKSLFLNHKSKFLVSLLIAFFLTLPVFISFLKSGGTTRFSGVGLFSDTGPLSRSEELLNQHPGFTYLDRIVHNKRVLYLLSWGQKYLSHFDLNFLFLKGDEVPRSKNPDLGLLYLFELPLIILGIFYLTKSKQKHLKIFVFSLLLISPLASSLTFQAPSALRSLPLTIPLTILVAYGLLSFKRTRLLIFLYFISFIYFADSYFIHAPKRYSFAWNAGFREIIPFVESQKPNYQNIFFTNHYDQPYILYLFFSKYPPRLLQPQIKLTPPDSFGFSTVFQIDNITFFIPDLIPPDSLVIDASDFQISSQSFKLYVK